MGTRASFVVLIVAGSALLGCSVPDGSLPRDATNALAMANSAGDVQSCVALFTDDAKILPPGGPIIEGKAAITTFCEEQGARDVSMSTDNTFSTTSGNLGADEGTYVMRDVRRGVNVESGRYLGVWRKAGEKWKYQRFMFQRMGGPKAAMSIEPAQ